MAKKSKILIVLLGVALIVSFVTYRQDLFEPSGDTPDLSSQSAYSKLQFGNEDTLLDIGGQPLTPHGVIYAVMKRDRILRSALAEHGIEAVRQVVAAQLRALTWIQASEDNLRMASRWTLSSAIEIGSTASVTAEGLFSSAVNEGLLSIPPSAVLFEEGCAEDNALFQEFKFAQGLSMISSATRWQDVVSCFDRELVPELISQHQRYRLYENDFIEDL